MVASELVPPLFLQLILNCHLLLVLNLLLPCHFVDMNCPSAAHKTISSYTNSNHQAQLSSTKLNQAQPSSQSSTKLTQHNQAQPSSQSSTKVTQYNQANQLTVAFCCFVVFIIRKLWRRLWAMLPLIPRIVECGNVGGVKGT